MAFGSKEFIKTDLLKALCIKMGEAPSDFWPCAYRDTMKKVQGLEAECWTATAASQQEGNGGGDLSSFPFFLLLWSPTSIPYAHGKPEDRGTAGVARKVSASGSRAGQRKTENLGSGGGEDIV